MDIENMDVEKSISQLYELGVNYAPKLVGAILVLIIGSWVIKALVSALSSLMDKRDLDPSLKTFIKSFLRIVLRIMLIISVLGMVGVEMTSFIALLGAAGVAIGLALSGTLQNFAGGVMILLFKPYRVGDFIDAQGYMGTVKEIQIFNTILKTPDNKTIIIPNGGLATGSMTNFSTEPRRRIDFAYGIGYGDSVDKGREVLLGLANADTRIIQEEGLAPQVMLDSLGDSSVNLKLRVWVESGDYWNVFFEMNENVYNSFNAQGLNIPFPQMDVHVHNK
ncbi:MULTISPECIES: mechanosensitive ion channel family protein [Reichenbachiella]|uniref:Small conductance mechanosensitive channel n=1 Tax=Reichenbachiella agariperforans TaxID=156994 RepID=A0A1M6KI76_REIAG|nr:MULTISPECIES: mechanosensitive ion channel domain-containing protein [Reichenbachiella]SHJ58653.1 small conductance mechanosensitive channel [Reichenbachiella agariperforans]